MIDDRFETWLGEASCADRCFAAERLCEVLREGTGDSIDRGLAGLLERLAVDASPKVRMILAERLGADSRTPSSIIRLLSEDIEPIAVAVAGRSPCLRADDLIDLVASGTTALRAAIAARVPLCEAVAAAIAGSGDRAACRTLLLNACADLSGPILRQIAVLAEGDGVLREHLARRADLPADLRHGLVLAVARRLGSADFVQNALGARTTRVTAESCDAATLLIARRVPAADLVAFSDELRRSGQVSTVLLVRTACSGELDFFAAALAALSGMSYRRVRATIVEASDGPFRALLAAAGVPAAAQTLMIIAVRTWKDAIAHGADAASSSIIVEVLDEITHAFRQTRSVDGVAELSHVLARLRAAAVRAMALDPETLRRAA